MTTSAYSNTQTTVSSIGGGYTSLTWTADGAKQGDDIPCRFCRLLIESSDYIVRTKINSACTNVTGLKLYAGLLVPYPIDNVNKLFFYGQTGALLHIEYFL
ncbi:MAG: hypothetical protein MUP81_03155 [Dehalococcoidia bacterium]|nr:hypothetical protein [Dehalococcoidia bacterium]